MRMLVLLGSRKATNSGNVNGAGQTQMWPLPQDPVGQASFVPGQLCARLGPLGMCLLRSRQSEPPPQVGTVELGLFPAEIAEASSGSADVEGTDSQLKNEAVGLYFDSRVRGEC